MNSAALSEKNSGIDVLKIREDFPMLKKQIKGKQIIYLDSAATGHKPKRVINKLYNFYLHEYGKPKESHALGRHSTEEVDKARKKIADFIGAASDTEIVFSRGCTESINMVAGGFERGLLKEGDEVLIT